MHTKITPDMVIIGRREMSRGAYAFHVVMIVSTFGLWAPVYWLHKASTKRVRY